MELKNKVVVITGGTRGFGKELAKLFLEQGSKVIVCSRSGEEVRNVSKEMDVLGIVADVTKEEELMSLGKQTIEKFGNIDIWINNAGIWIPKTPVIDLDMNKVRDMFNVNVLGTINGSRVALRFMKENKTRTLVNIISDSALIDQPRISASVYGASKWAVNGFTKAIRGENSNVLILSIFPGAMQTSLFGKDKPENFGDFMDARVVAQKVIDNLKKEKPEIELVIKRENA